MLQRHTLSLSKYANMRIMIIIAESVTFNILLKWIIWDNSLPAEFLPDFAFANSLLHLDFTRHSLPANTSLGTKTQVSVGACETGTADTKPGNEEMRNLQLTFSFTSQCLHPLET